VFCAWRSAVHSAAQAASLAASPVLAE
jgi:hypothetical protein